MSKSHLGEIEFESLIVHLHGSLDSVRQLANINWAATVCQAMCQTERALRCLGHCSCPALPCIVLLASPGQRPLMLWNILWCVVQLPLHKYTQTPTKNYLTQNINSAKVEKPCFRAKQNVHWIQTIHTSPWALVCLIYLNLANPYWPPPTAPAPCCQGPEFQWMKKFQRQSFKFYFSGWDSKMLIYILELFFYFFCPLLISLDHILMARALSQMAVL